MLPSGSLEPDALAATASGALPVRGVTASTALGGWLGRVTTTFVCAVPESALAARNVTVKLPVSPAPGVQRSTPDRASRAGVNAAVFPGGSPAR